MKIGVCKETSPGERRVALIPESVGALAKLGHEVLVEAGAGTEAGFTDAAYREKGATVLDSRSDVIGQAGALFQVRGLGATPDGGAGDLALMKRDRVLVAMCDPLGEADKVKESASSGVVAFSMPRKAN